MTMPVNTPGGIRSGGNPEAGPWPRQMNLIAAIWLFISAFIWPHARALRTDTWVTAVLMFAAALAALRTPKMRYWNTVLAVWLFLSTASMGSARNAVLLNNLIVAVVVFVLSLIPGGANTPRRRISSPT